MHESSTAGGEDDAPREDGATTGGARPGAGRTDGEQSGRAPAGGTAAPAAGGEATGGATAGAAGSGASAGSTAGASAGSTTGSTAGGSGDVPATGEGGGAAEPARARRAPERSQAEQDEIFAALVAQFDDPVDLNNPNWPEIENLRARGEFKNVKDRSDADRFPGEPGDLSDLAPQPRPRSGRPVMPAAGSGPRDFELSEDTDEGHFEPPEPPPLPEADTTAKFAWLAVLGGPALLLFDAVVWREVAGWPAWVGVAAFLGGFATLVVRMKDHDEDEPEDPHGGAVV